MGGKATLAGGIVSLIIGIVLAVGGSAAQSYSSSDRAACESALGQTGQFLSQDIRDRCATMTATSTFGGVGQLVGYGLAVVGIVLIAVGGVQVSRNKKSASW